MSMVLVAGSTIRRWLGACRASKERVFPILPIGRPLEWEPPFPARGPVLIKNVTISMAPSTARSFF